MDLKATVHHQEDDDDGGVSVDHQRPFVLRRWITHSSNSAGPFYRCCTVRYGARSESFTEMGISDGISEAPLCQSVVCCNGINE